MKKVFVLFLIMAGIIFIISPFSYSNNCNEFDVNDDCKLGVEEVIFLLRELSGISHNIQINKEELEKILNESIIKVSSSLNENGISQLANIFSLMNLDSLVNTPQKTKSITTVQAAIDSLLNLSFDCGNIQQDGINTVIFSFNGSCNNISGDVRVTPSISMESLSLNIAFDNLTSDKTSFNGTLILNIALEGDSYVTLSCETQNLIINNQQFNGTIIIKITTGGELASIKMQGESDFNIDSKQGTIKYNLTQNPAVGINGHLEITLNDITYYCELENIMLDPICHIPTSGKMIINDMILDFNNTECTNPLVTVTVKSYTFDLSIEQAIEYLSGMNKNQELEQFVNTSIIKVSSNLNENGINQLSNIFTLMNLDSLMESNQRKSITSVQTAIDALFNLSFECGTIQKDGLSVIFSFNGSCNNLSGDVRVSPVISIDGFSLNIDFDNLTNNKTLIDGELNLSLSLEGYYYLILTCETQNLKINNELFNGTIIIKLTKNGELASIKMQGDSDFNSNSKQGTIKYNLTQNPATGINGNLVITLNDITYYCELENIMLDPICHIPTSGTMNINGMLLDFSNTECLNPIVTVTVNSYTFDISIEQAIEYLKTQMSKYQELESVANASIIKVSSNLNENGISQLSNIFSLMKLNSLMGLQKQKSVTSITTLIESLLNLSFECGTIQNEGLSVIFSFNGNCNNISGDVKVAPVISADGFSLNIDFDDLTNNKTLIDGELNLSFTFEGYYYIILTCKTQNLIINNQQFNGTIIIKLTIESELASITINGESDLVINSKAGKITYDLIQNPAVGINGSLDITLDDVSYNCELENIMLDPICHIPTSGTMNINGMLLDFSNTECLNPLVTVTVYSYTFDLSIEQAIEYLTTGMNK